jgi:hypothetical protein
MKTESYYIVSSILQFVIAIGAIVFGYLQFKINSKLKKLQETIGLSIVPGIGLKLLFMNIGKINLYLKKYEIGPNTEDFDKPLLIAAGTNSFLQIEVPNLERNKKYNVKIYLIDDFNEKYLSTGEFIIEDVEVEVIQPRMSPFDSSITPGATSFVISKMKTPQIKAWSYKTEKYNWTI